ncbi:two component transcriptional regulator, LuxR family [Seinonella peptonophila]|uniref:Two component transcriptional regulator, LuxR family n=1 Tax=Seinonella peptonophila TaxID=112248 RepID=A0A1M4XRL9_9BACL|nr:response regulator transcription factor [Seinonella peptonophila]SHE96129.1 two component transcriptional regulator, LuxR family [Seinonella peptonophila]
MERQPPVEQEIEAPQIEMVSTPPIRVVIADSNQKYRNQCKENLKLKQDIQLVGECCEGLDVPILCDTLRPHIAIVDLHLSRMDGVEITYRLSQIAPETRVLIMSEKNDPYAVESIRSGARGYLLKNVNQYQVVEALRVIARGGYYIHPVIMEKLVTELRRLSHQETAFHRIHTTEQSTNWQEILTYREMEVLRLMTQGKNNRAISEHLYISEKTVKNHVSNILYKLGVQDRTQAVLMAIKCRWVQLI